MAASMSPEHQTVADPVWSVRQTPGHACPTLVFLVSLWAYPNRSLTKAAQTVQKHALHLASAFASVKRLAEALGTVKCCRAVGCRMNRRKKYPNTYQLLLDATSL